MKKLQNKYLPMTEAAYYVLISLNKPRHGYGIMQHVNDITNERINIGTIKICPEWKRKD